MQCLYLEFVICPVKNVLWVLMEIPCHFPSSQIDGRLSSKLTPNSMTIPCYLSRFHLFSMLEHDKDFGQVQVMEFPWHLLKSDGISRADSVSFSNQTKL